MTEADGVIRFRTPTAKASDYRAIRWFMQWHYWRSLRSWLLVGAVFLPSLLLTFVVSPMTHNVFDGVPELLCLLCMMVIIGNIYFIYVSGVSRIMHSSDTRGPFSYELDDERVRVIERSGELAELLWSQFIGYTRVGDRLLIVHRTGMAFFFPERMLGPALFSDVEQALARHLPQKSFFR